MPEQVTTIVSDTEPIAAVVSSPLPAVAGDVNPLVAVVPSYWREFIGAPLSWAGNTGEAMLDLFLGSSGWVAMLLYLLVLFPAFLLFAGVACTSVSLYTLPFRSGRLDFVRAMLLAWWDGGVAIWLYWTGLGRFFLVIIGWLFSLGRMGVQLFVEIVRQIIIVPFSKTGKMTQSYFQPGVPWIAFVLVVLWCLMEALIFTYTLFPTITEVLSGIVGKEAPELTAVVLYAFLAFLILGSFACMHALAEAVRNKDYKFLVQMILIEVFVMVFEVMFLYRELVDAITPWIAQQTSEGFRPGLWFTLGLATFGWVGIRGMTWFLFGQFGTPPLLAFISRRPMAQPDLPPGAEVPEEPQEEEPWWREPLADFKREIGWLHTKANELLEYVTLPFIHVLAGTINFGMILVTGHQAFSIPFKTLQEALQIRENLAIGRLQPKKANV